MPTPLVPGYSLGKILGQGTSGRVYAATDSSGRDVALKLLTSRDIKLPKLRARFDREISLLSKVTHPALAPLLDTGEVDGVPYLVFPRYFGGDLSTRIATEPLGVPEARCLALRIGGALAAIHKAGAVHRDVKPANIFLGPGGLPVLGDLGLVRAKTDSPLTTVGMAVGSLGYMSPEIRRGEPASPASDLFSLGVVLLESAGGGRPVVTAREVMIPFRGRPPGLSPAGDALVRRLLEAASSLRLSSHELADGFSKDEGANEDSATLSLTLDQANRAAETARRASTRPLLAAAAPAAQATRPVSGEPAHPSLFRKLTLGAGVSLTLAALGWSLSTPATAPPLPPVAPSARPSLTDVPSLLRGLEHALAEDLKRIEQVQPGRPGLAKVLAWLAAGNDPAALPQVVQARLLRHDAQLKERGQTETLGPYLSRPCILPGSEAERDIRAKIEAFEREP